MATPDLGVRRPPGQAVQVDDGPPAGQLADRLDVDAVGGRLDEVRHGEVPDRHGVVDRRAVPAVALPVEPREEPQEVGEDPRRPRPDGHQPLHVRVGEQAPGG